MATQEEAAPHAKPEAADYQPETEALLREASGIGSVEVNDDVIGLIVSIAMVEVEGVVSLSGKSSFSDYVGLKSKDVEKGVTVKSDPKTGHVSVKVEVNIEYGTTAYDVARKLQRKVKDAVENYAGMTVDRVDVTIKGLVVLENPSNRNRF